MTVHHRNASAQRQTEALQSVVDVHLDHRVRRLLTHVRARGWHLATAESLSGGLLASLLTDVPGASHVLDRSVVAYSDQAKVELLGVPESVLSTEGAVSRRTAEHMAEGLLSPAVELAISLTGFADVGDEPGLVHFAVAMRGGPTVHRARRYGTVGRHAVRRRAIADAVALLEEVIRPDHPTPD